MLKPEVVKFDGTYKTEGNKILVTLSNGEEKRKDTWTVTMLTDDEPLCSYKNDKWLTYSRCKDK